MFLCFCQTESPAGSTKKYPWSSFLSLWFVNIEGDYLNYVEQNKKVIGCNSLGYNVFSDKKLLRCY